MLSACSPAPRSSRLLGLPNAVFAAAPGDRRLVIMLLRGALDGLAAVPPLERSALSGKARQPRAEARGRSRRLLRARSYLLAKPLFRGAADLLAEGRVALRPRRRQRLSHALAFRRAGPDGERTFRQDRDQRWLAQPRSRLAAEGRSPPRPRGGRRGAADLARHCPRRVMGAARRDARCLARIYCRRDATLPTRSAAWARHWRTASRRRASPRPCSATTT